MGAVKNIVQLENYVARYLHQDLGKLQEWTWEELTMRFDDTLDLIRAEKGLPPRDAWNPDQSWM